MVGVMWTLRFSPVYPCLPYKGMVRRVWNVSGTRKCPIRNAQIGRLNALIFDDVRSHLKAWMKKWNPSFDHNNLAYACLMQVISSMRVLMTEDSNNAVSNSFLLDDDSRSAVWTLSIFSASAIAIFSAFGFTFGLIILMVQIFALPQTLFWHES